MGKKENTPVLFVNPPFYKFIGFSFRHNPLGLRYMASVLRKDGFPAYVWNFDFPRGHVFAGPPLPPYSANMGKEYKAKMEDPNHPIWKEVTDVLNKYRPKILGISIMTPQLNSAVKIAQIAKRLDPEIKIVVGGFHPTALPEETLKDNPFDILVKGEGEYTVLELANTLLEGKDLRTVAGITFKENGEIISNQRREPIADLDALPYPLREFATPEEEAYFKFRPSILTGRGCPYNCTFCARAVMWSSKIRYRSAESVVDEIQYLYDKYGCKYYMFEDDTWVINIERAYKICDLILERGLDITWECQTRANVVVRYKDILPKMKKAGCTAVDVGVESGNQQILDDIKKKITLNQVKETARLVKDAGIEVRSFFIIGYPQDTKDTIQDTVNLINEVDFDFDNVYLLVPMPGSEMYDKVKSEGKLLADDWFYYYFQNPNVFKRDHISNKELYEKFVELSKFVVNKRRRKHRQEVLKAKHVYRKLVDNIGSPRRMAHLAKEFGKLALKRD